MAQFCIDRHDWTVIDIMKVPVKDSELRLKEEGKSLQIVSNEFIDKILSGIDVELQSSD